MSIILLECFKHLKKGNVYIIMFTLFSLVKRCLLYPLVDQCVLLMFNYSCKRWHNTRPNYNVLHVFCTEPCIQAFICTLVFSNESHTCLYRYIVEPAIFELSSNKCIHLFTLCYCKVILPVSNHTCNKWKHEC